MSTTPVIFPSLTRAPSMDTSLQVQDDTIRDQFDAGYVATRPRFTRSRRTWNINIRNLTAEDVRTLDVFAEQTVQRGALPFYFPNLLPNWSFEITQNPGGAPNAANEILPGWVYLNLSSSPEAQAAVYPYGGNDGSKSLAFKSVAGIVVPAAAPAYGWGSLGVAAVPTTEPFACNPGETYQFCGLVTLGGGDLNPGLLVATQVIITWNYPSGAQVQTFLSTYTMACGSGAGASQSYSQQFSAPESAGVYATSFDLWIAVYFENTSGVAQTLDNTALVLWDEVGLALCASQYQPYGRMAGSSNLPCAVRFAANKLPQFADLGYGNGVKVYGTTFALEEV